MDDTPSEQPALRARRHPRRRTSVVGVVGEILITAGVVALLYVSWQLWIGDMIIGSQLKDEAQTRAQQWESAAPTAKATPSATPAPSDSTGPDSTGPDSTAPDSAVPDSAAPDSAVPAAAPPPLPAEADDSEVFGIMRIPRFGQDYFFDLLGGVSTRGSLDQGIGHYPGTAMPGQEGNFAVAGHRGSHGAPFQDLPSLRVGDAIVVQTPDGWYTYRFRNLEYVQPSQVDVLLPVPQVLDASANAQYITLTTCSPRYGSSERAIAYGIYESFTPVSAGPPAALTEGIPA